MVLVIIIGEVVGEVFFVGGDELKIVEVKVIGVGVWDIDGSKSGGADADVSDSLMVISDGVVVSVVHNSCLSFNKIK